MKLALLISSSIIFYLLRQTIIRDKKSSTKINESMVCWSCEVDKIFYLTIIFIEAISINLGQINFVVTNYLKILIMMMLTYKLSIIGHNDKIILILSNLVLCIIYYIFWDNNFLLCRETITFMQWKVRWWRIVGLINEVTKLSHYCI